MQVELLAVLLDILFERVVHNMELWQPLKEQTLHFDRLVLEEMHEGEEREVLVVVHDLQDDRNDEVHTLAVADRGKYISDGAEDPFELILPFLSLYSARGIRSGKITLNLLYDGLVKILRGLSVFLVR